MVEKEKDRTMKYIRNVWKREGQNNELHKKWLEEIEKSMVHVLGYIR